MSTIYFDNAATTPVDPEVLEAMLPYLKEHFGNPSSTHSFGRKAKGAIENTRKSIADRLNVSPAEIHFTSGGTEADNLAIQGAVNKLNVERIISSPLEHHAVLHTVEEINKQESVELAQVKVRQDGHIDLDHLEELLKAPKKTLVSLMHANNEIGNLLPIEKVGSLCEQYGAWFHSDTVQTMGHYSMDLASINVHFATCAAHKFHGPKGVGFLYIDKDVRIEPMIWGGPQEKSMRGGTENVPGVIGIGKAFEIAHRDLETCREQIAGLKAYMIEALEKAFPGVGFNGDAKGDSLYTVLNVCLPRTEHAEMLLFNLDLDGIAASGGSACSSGSNKGSHVLSAIGSDPERPSVRFSFSKYNTREEVDRVVAKLKELVKIPEGAG